ncbi:hypothetical protein SAMN04489713_107121 [Actinomadura madurae]|uniref:Uncharacterized protein n=2 Tax=Actinomadura madurae TaxID=1993 RepID=A0A1I5I5S5_9ACTN|nr:hypothetical protein SAMN04489713_107121 [Actinomadura madurae]
MAFPMWPMLPGMTDVYEHVTPPMREQVLRALQRRWETSLLALRSDERDRLIAALPQTDRLIGKLRTRHQAEATGENIIAQISPNQA